MLRSAPLRVLGSACQSDFGFDRGVAARVENLPRLDFLNLRDDVHDCFLSLVLLCGETGDYIGFLVWPRAPSPARLGLGKACKAHHDRAWLPSVPPATEPLELHSRGRGRPGHTHLPSTGRVYAGSSSFSQAGHRLCSRVEQDVRSHGNSGSGLARAGISAVGGEP